MIRTMLDDFHQPPTVLHHPFAEGLSRIATVRPDQHQSFKVVGQSAFQEHLRPRSLWHVGFGDEHFEQQPQDVDEDMPFTTGDFLGRIVSSFTGDGGGLDRLAILDRGARLSLALLLFSYRVAQCCGSIHLTPTVAARAPSGGAAWPGAA